jgi:hypothetical protein
VLIFVLTVGITIRSCTNAKTIDTIVKKCKQIRMEGKKPKTEIISGHFLSGTSVSSPTPLISNLPLARFHRRHRRHAINRDVRHQKTSIPRRLWATTRRAGHLPLPEHQFFHQHSGNLLSSTFHHHLPRYYIFLIEI